MSPLLTSRGSLQNGTGTTAYYRPLLHSKGRTRMPLPPPLAVGVAAPPHSAVEALLLVSHWPLGR